MVQTFNPDTVMLSQSGGQEIKDAGFTREFLQTLVAQSKTLRSEEHTSELQSHA